ncbi:MAG: 5'/3'-nucleotidase SurE [Bacteroidales bacterium]|nr:5'/3'-nucleotidase SurE [Bacteroidales bacterium]
MKKKNKQPLILLTNDDGVDAKGIRVLLDIAKEFGRVVMVAPAVGRSGMSHAITFNTPLRLKRIYQDPNVEIYRCSGTPADCVKLAQRYLLKNEKIDLLVSGINQGSNTSASTHYSGTVAAAMEGCINGLKAVAFSIVNYSSPFNCDAALEAAKKIIPLLLENDLPKHVCLNVNIPNIPASDIKGYKITRQANNYWIEDMQERKDPMDRPYFWMSGDMYKADKGRDTDQWAVEHNYVSVTPIKSDMTAYEAMEEFKQWKLKKTTKR